uniref:Uncharacterized protein n=1 Tax=Brassica oleracea var. oleracea TaxID=109376 RepID=A0A0D3DT81_BRAOL
MPCSLARIDHLDSADAENITELNNTKLKQDSCGLHLHAADVVSSALASCADNKTRLNKSKGYGFKEGLYQGGPALTRELRKLALPLPYSPSRNIQSLFAIFPRS